MKKKDDVLTDREKEFCYNYIQNFNAYQSALKVGYSESYAKTHIYGLIKSPKVKNFLKELKEERQREILLSQEELINRHLKIAFSDIADFINDDGTLKKNIDGSLIKKITVKSSKTVTDEVTKENNVVSIELEDRKESLKFLTEYMGLDEKLKLAKNKYNFDKEKFIIMTKLKELEILSRTDSEENTKVANSDFWSDEQLGKWAVEAWGDELAIIESKKREC